MFFFSVFCVPSNIILSDIYGCFCLRNAIGIVLTEGYTAGTDHFYHRNRFHQVATASTGHFCVAALDGPPMTVRIVRKTIGTQRIQKGDFVGRENAISSWPDINE